MHTKHLFGAAVLGLLGLVIFPHSFLLAEEAPKKIQKSSVGMVAGNQQLATVSQSSDKAQLPEGVGPKTQRPGQGDLPSKGKNFRGSQGGFNPIKVGGGATSSQGNTQQMSKGMTDMLQRGKKTDEKKTMAVGDLSREARMKKLLDPKAGLEKGGRPVDFGGPLTRPAQGRDGLLGTGTTQPVIEKGTVGRDAGKRDVSKKDQQSSGKGNQYGKDYNEYGMYGRNESIQTPDGLAGTIKYDNDGRIREYSRFDAVTGKEETWRLDKGGKVTEHTVKDLNTGKTEKKSTSTPLPDDVDESTLPTFLQRQPKELVDPNIARKRQVSLENEGKRQLELEPVDVSFKDVVAKRTDGLTQPVEGDGTTEGSSSTKQFWQGKGPKPDDSIDDMTGGGVVEGIKPPKPKSAE